MFNYNLKRILTAVMFIGIISVVIPIRSYESFAGQTPEFSLLTYCFGLVIGFAAMLASIHLDYREPKNTEPAIMKKSGIAILASLLIILAGIATGIGYFLSSYMPEKIGFVSLSYMAGLVIGFAAIVIVYYLPNYLPQEKPSDYIQNSP